MFRAITTTTLEKIEEKAIKIRTFGKKTTNNIHTFILAKGMPLPPMIVFKGVPEGSLEHRLNMLKQVIEKNICCLSKQYLG